MPGNGGNRPREQRDIQSWQFSRESDRDGTTATPVQDNRLRKPLLSYPQAMKSSRELQHENEIDPLLATLRRVAVLGIKTAAQVDQPAYYVPAALSEDGLQIIPVPVYYPEATHILGQPVFRRVADIVEPADLVCVFRRPRDLAAHLDDLLAARPPAVWLQSGIREASFARNLLDNGIDVVQDRCLMVEYARFLRNRKN